MTAPKLPLSRVLKAGLCRLSNSLHIAQAGLSNRITHGVFAGMLLMLPCSQKALALPPSQALDKQINSTDTRPVEIGKARVVNLTQQPGTNGDGSLVKVLPASQPQSLPVAQEQPQKKCQNGDCGVFEKFVEDHPVASNLLYACLTFVAGWYMSGGRMPFARFLRGSKGGAA